MRKALLLFLVAGSASAALAQSRSTLRKLTVAELEQTLAAAHGQTDGQLAEQISALELTDRLSVLRRSSLDAGLPGAESRRALSTLGEASEFLDLPIADIPSMPAPDRAAQVSMIALARSYVLKTITRLPNFFATRETTNLEGAPPKPQVSALHSSKWEPFHAVGRSSVTVLYRDHHELAVKGRKGEVDSTRRLQTMGEFGPVLVTILNDAAKGRLNWSHWEQGTAGPMAVFRYAIPAQESHYMVSSSSFEHEATHDPAYHGEISLNPADGSILRLTVIAELNASDPMTIADLLVEYAPVEIGAVTYVCPAKSIALSQVRMVVQQLNFTTGDVESTSLGPARNYLNEVLFQNYHLFRGDTRILAGNGRQPAEMPSASPSQ